MGEKHFGFYLDASWDKMWHEVERIQDGGANHRVSFMAETSQDAARIMAERLIPFIEAEMYESDDDGRPIQWLEDQ